MKHSWTTAEAWGKGSAVLVASALLYAAFCVFCVTGLPVSSDLAMAVGILGGFPVWIGAMCYAVLARSATRAWGALCALALALGAGALLAESLV